MSPGVRDLGADLVDLGLALGIFVPGADGPELNAAWFEDPAARLTAVLRDPAQRRAALDLARRALGEADADDLDLRQVPAGESWLPLANSATVPGSIYAVVAEDGGDVWLGLGARMAAPESPAARLDSSATVLVPLASFPAAGAAELLLGSPGGVVRIGVAVEAPDGLAEAGATADLRGLTVDAHVPTDGSATPTLSVALKGLRLPGEAERDLVISEPSQLDREAAQIAAGLLAARAGAADGALAHLLSLLGLGPDPTNPIPSLPVAQLAARGLRALDDWARALIADPAAVRAWLAELAGLAGAGAPAVSGDGSAEDPYEVEVRTAPRVVLNLRVTPDPGTGLTVLRPGVRVEVAGGLGRAVGEAELAAVRLSSPPAALALPKLLALVALEGAPLAEARVRDFDVMIGSLRVGVGLDERRAPIPVLEARDVSIDGTIHPVIDLSSAAAVAGEVGELAGALTSALTSRPEGRALAAIGGLVRPDGVAAGDPWPALVRPAELLANPIRAVAAYHAAVLAQAGAWARLARELAVLAGASGLPAGAASGSGTPASPWALPLAEDALGRVELLAWSAAGPRLHLGARLALAPAAVEGKELALEARSELLALDLPAGGPFGATWAPQHSAGARLGEELVFDPGPVALLARSVAGAFTWTAGRGTRITLLIEQPKLRYDGTEVALPDIDWGGTGPPVDLARLPWDALESLAGQALDALGGSAARLAVLAGWAPGNGPITVHPPSLPDLELSLDPATLPRLSLQLLAGDPAGAVRLWVEELLHSEAAFPALAWLSNGTLSGSGTPDDPWALRPLPAAPELLIWLEPDGPMLAAHPELVDHLLPDPIDAEHAAALLARAAALAPELRDLLAARSQLEDQLVALRSRLEQGDGIVRAADAVPAGAPWTSITLAAGHLDLPAAFDPALHLPADAPPAARHVYLCAALPGVRSWRGQAAEIDLTAPGLPPEGFDLSGIPTSGPWYVRLPTREAAGGFNAAVARARRALDAIRSAAGAPICLIAHSTAGLVGRALAAEEGVSHLVTVGTPHAGAGLDALVPGDPAEGLRVLLALRDLVGDPDGSLGEPLHALEVAADGWLPAPDTRPRRAPWPGADFAPPPFAPLHPTVAAARAVVGQTDPSAFGDFVRAVLVAAASRLGGFDPDARPPSAIGLGLRRVQGPGELRLDLWPQRRLQARATLVRTGAWLAGDAGQGPGPRVRWAQLEVDAGLDPLDLETRVVLHEASVFGLTIRRWTIDRDSLAPEARVLLGEVARGLGPLPSTGGIAALGDLLVALGVVELATDRTPTLSPDGLERFMLDPAGVLRQRLAGDASLLIGALARLLGAPEPADGEAIVVPLAAGVNLSLFTPPAPLATLRAVSGPLVAEATLEGDGRVHGAAVASPLAATLDTDRPEPLTLTLDGLALLPAADVSAIRRRSGLMLLGELLRTGLEWMGSREPVLRPVLDALALGGSPLANPATLLADPGGWLARPEVAGNTPGLLRLFDAVRGLAAPGSPAGPLALPWGLRAAAAADGDDAVLTVDWAAPPAGANVELDGELALRIVPGSLVSPRLAATLRLANLVGIDSLALDLAFDGRRASARLRVRLAAGPEVVIPLVPSAGGLGAFGGLAPGAILEAILPLALDALAGGPDPVVPALANAGDALGLRAGGQFEASAVRAFAADPWTQVRARAATALPRAAELVATVLPVTSSQAGLRPATGVPFLAIRPLDHLRLELEVPSAGPLRLCALLTGATPVAGLALDGRACVTDAGIEAIELAAEVTDPDLLRLGPVSLFPLAGVSRTGVEAGVWLAPPGAAERRALVARRAFADGGVELTCRPATGPDLPDLGPCAADAVRAYLVPLATDLVVGAPAVVARLDRALPGAAKTLGDVLVEAGILIRRGAGGYELAAGALDPSHLPAHVFALLARLVTALTAPLAPAGLPVEIQLIQEDADAGRTRYGARLSLPRAVELFAEGGLRLQMETNMERFAAGEAGIELLAVSLPTAGADPLDAAVDPAIRIRGLGLRALAEEGGHLVDLVASIDALAIHGVYERDAAGVSRAGGRILLVNLGVPLGRAAGGGNPVAAKVLSGGAEERPTGDQAELRPAISPQLVILREGPPPAQVSFSAGEGEGPWWLPIQKRFGPLYVEQVGLGTEPVDRARFLVDGGVSLAGLNLGVDDLSLSIPWRRPRQRADWRIDLAGRAVGYRGGAVAIAGGLRKRPATPPAAPDYVGMLQVTAGQFQLAAVGGYAEIPESPEASRTYTSLFVFAALSFPLGGPPAFFITGLGGGLGLNRRLVLPADVNEVPRFSLVAAMDPDSPFAADPMSALQLLGQDFPPARGTFWGAAGVRFRSFALVESIAVLSIEVGDGVEVSLLGLSRMDIPPALPLARIELALRARFSTREMVLAIQAQLTDNSWLLNPSCRLTGGFAFVIWFREGQFVLTLGGYHPRFSRPARFPDVPRLGFNWSVSDALAIKGESYFALTATCVMAGGRLEAAFNAGRVWASFAYGMDALVSWDPFFYDVSGFVRVSAGVRIKVHIPFDGDVGVTLSLSIGAEVHVWGPELRGEARLDLDVTSVTVRFGSTGAESGRDKIGWAQFLERYLVAGDPDGATMSAAVTSGLLIADPGASRREPGTGKPGGPWRVVPEFAVRTETRSASNLVAFGDPAQEASLAPVTTEHIDLGPMFVTNVTSRHAVRLTEDAAGAADRTARLRHETVTTNVPEGIWRFDSDGPAPAAEVRPAFTGALLVAESQVPSPQAEVSLLQVEETRHPLPLPFGDEIADRSEFEPDAARADAYAGGQPRAVGAILGRAAELMGVSARRLGAERVAPPRLAPLTEGMVDAVKGPVSVTETPAPEPPGPPDRRVRPPRLLALLREGPAPTLRGPAPTSVDERAAQVRRVAPPSLARVLASGGARLGLTAPVAQAMAGTLAAPDGGPATRAAGAGVEGRPGLRASESVAASLERLEAALAAGRPVVLTPGDVQVWDLPNAAFDADNPRPVLTVKGDQLARALALDRGGELVAEASGEIFELELGEGASRIAVAGEGRAEGASGAPTAAGWHAGTRLRRLSAIAFVASGAVVTAPAAATLRDRRPATVALVTAADAVAGRATVSTRLPPGVHALLVALEPAPDADVELEGLVLGLEGATRDGAEPQTVVAGPRTYRVFGLEPDPDAAAVVATVASDERWALAAVIGSAAAPVVLAGELLHRGLEQLLDAGARSPLGASELKWHANQEVSR
ncbi:MAG: putative transcriptional activator [Geminicoccaceae bacterium]|nr:putative transcriptional activator [Geminicoccaceae bacterium]